MNKEQQRDLYRTALQKYGVMPQVLMVVEECGELLSALSKYNRSRIEAFDVITELADVCIMVEQMAELLGYDEFEKEKDRKLNRLKNRLDNG